MSIATITLTSDITDDALSVIARSNLTKAGSGFTPLDQFTGVNTLQYATTQSAITFIDAGDYVDTEVAHKVYIRNAVDPAVSSTSYVLVEIDSSANEPLGRLYPGDWCFFPWLGTLNIDITTVEVGATVEYAVISQSIVTT